MDKIVLLPTEKYSTISSVLLWLLCGLGMFLALILVVNAVREWPGPSSTKGLLIGVPIFVFMVWLRWQFMGQSTITITRDSISQRQPVVSPRVNWNMITSINVRESTNMVNGAGAQVRVHRRIAEIKTKQNRTVVMVLSTLSAADQQLVERYMREAAQTGTLPVDLATKLK